MKLRDRDNLSVRPNTRSAKKRQLEGQKDSRHHEDNSLKGSISPPGLDPPELGRGKRSRLAPKKKPAAQPIEQKTGPGPSRQRELPVELSAEQAVNDAEVQQWRESSLVDDKILELLSDASPPESNSLLEADNEIVRPMPPKFQENLRKLRQKGELSETTEKYFLNLGSGDSCRVLAGQGSRKSLLEDVLREDVQKAENNEGESRVSGWKSGKELGQGGFGKVTLWEKAHQNGQVCLKYP